jgi:hypothetical protein
MPVQKFRTFEAARRALWLASDDPSLWDRMRRLAQMAQSRRPVRRGVTRYRSIEEAKRYKDPAYEE